MCNRKNLSPDYKVVITIHSSDETVVVVIPIW